MGCVYIHMYAINEGAFCAVVENLALLVSSIRFLSLRESVRRKPAKHLLSLLVLWILSCCRICSQIAELMLSSFAFCNLAVSAIAPSRFLIEAVLYYIESVCTALSPACMSLSSLS
jgi:hypothetical protein